jgi:hypothetical protein
MYLKEVAMKSTGKSVVVYHATPLCRKCHEELSKVQKASSQEGSGMQVRYSLWKRIKYGLRFLSMPVVVVDGKPFSVLGMFDEASLRAELKGKTAVQ